MVAQLPSKPTTQTTTTLSGSCAALYGSTLDKVLQYGVGKGYYPQSDIAAIKNRINQMAAKYQFSPDDFALFTLIESDGMAPRAGADQVGNNAECIGIIQFCCVSLDTEVLTPSGWKTHSQINVGDTILSYNPSTRLIEEDVAINKFFYKDAPTIRMHNKRFDFVSTPNHRWLVEHYSDSNKLLFKETKDLTSSTPYNLLRSGYFDFPKSKTYSDEIVSLAGWVFTDGSIKTTKGLEITIAQSFTANPTKCKIINDLVLSAGGKEGTFIKALQDTTMQTWRLYGQPAKDIASLLTTNKTLSYDTLKALTYEQALLLYEACILGDGSITKGKYIQFTQQDSADIEGFQLLCLFLNKIANSVLNTKKKSYEIYPNGKEYIIRPQYRVCVRANQRTETRKERMNYTPEVTQDVWCLQSNNSTWICRRNGQITITGNSFGGLPVIGKTRAEVAVTSTLNQLDYVDTYFEKNNLPKGASLEDLYLTVLNPASRDIKDPNADLGIGGKQASILYSGSSITRNSIRSGLVSLGQERLACAPTPGSGSPGVLAGGGGPVQAGAIGTDSAILSGENCPPPPFNQRDRIVYVGCKSKIASATKGGSGFGYASNGVAYQGTPTSSTNGLSPYTGPLRPGAFILPCKGKIISPFGPRWGRLHKGIDIATPVGTPIYAIADGVVAEGSGLNVNPEGYGNLLILTHKGSESWYGHPSEISVVVGQVVKQGQIIGATGGAPGVLGSGNSKGPHLHFEIRPGGKAADPTQFYSQNMSLNAVI